MSLGTHSITLLSRNIDKREMGKERNRRDTSTKETELYDRASICFIQTISDVKRCSRRSQMLRRSWNTRFLLPWNLIRCQNLLAVFFFFFVFVFFFLIFDVNQRWCLYIYCKRHDYRPIQIAHHGVRSAVTLGGGRMEMLGPQRARLITTESRKNPRCNNWVGCSITRCK